MIEWPVSSQVLFSIRDFQVLILGVREQAMIRKIDERIVHLDFPVQEEHLSPRTDLRKI
jgi:hypothetical protein